MPTILKRRVSVNLHLPGGRDQHLLSPGGTAVDEHSHAVQPSARPKGRERARPKGEPFCRRTLQCSPRLPCLPRTDPLTSSMASFALPSA
jgi:hypothetical protein